MSRCRSRNLLWLLGVGVGAWAVNQAIRRARLRARPDFYQGKAILLTGASRGIGREMALRFAERGANLALAARSEQQLLEVARACSALNPGGRALVVPTDVTVDSDLENLVNVTVERLGQIDILVNNAGIIQGGCYTEVGRESIRQTVEVNLMAAMRLTQLVLPHMQARGEGQIVNVSSASEGVAYPYFVAYSASKHALKGFSDGLRRELAGTGIKVLRVSPGYVETDFVDVVGSAYRRMGLPIWPPERVALRTVDAIPTGQNEVFVGQFEAFSGKVNALFPGLVDLFWRWFLPADFPDLAARQRTE
jgi:short-subunit dehydrogenase